MMRFDDEQQMPGRRPNQDALLQQLGGGAMAQLGGGSRMAEMGPNAGRMDQLAPDAATASAWRNNPANPLKAAMAGLQPDAPSFAPGEQVGAPKASRGPASINSIWDKMTSYAHTPQGLQQFFAENPDLVEGASIMGSKGDKIQFGDGKIYDVIQAAGEGGKSWQQLWDNDPNAAPDPVSRGGGLFGGGGGMPAFMSQDPNAAIQGQMGRFAENSPNIAALIQQLMGGRG